MQQSPTWDANQFSASLDISRMVWNLKVHYRIHKSTIPVPILSQIKTVYSLPYRFLNVHFNIILPSDPSSSKWTLSGFPTKALYALLLSPDTRYMPAYLIILDLITRMIFGEQYRSWSSSLWSFLHYPVTSSILGSNILLRTPFSNTLILRSSPNMSDHVSHPYKTIRKINVL
jgi:hypothetical protein